MVEVVGLSPPPGSRAKEKIPGSGKSVQDENQKKNLAFTPGSGVEGYLGN